MNQLDCELNALGRIIAQVKAYRQMSANTPVHAEKQKLDYYLWEHLSPADWRLWRSLHITPAPPVHSTKRGNNTQRGLPNRNT